MRHFGIIGKPLTASFSADHFNAKFAAEHIDAEYSKYPLECIDDYPALLQSVRERYPEDTGLCGLNVTIPYKSAVMPFLSRLDETARAIGAVNVIRFHADGRTTGYNTDAIGFMDSIRPHLLPTDRQALVLGTGGAAKACFYGLQKLGLTPTYVSRTPQDGMLGYDRLHLGDYTVIVNCTPLGMHPDTEKMPPIPYDELTQAHFLYDCIYHPGQTRFLREGERRGCRTQNGMPMLLGQAHAAWTIWNQSDNE